MGSPTSTATKSRDVKSADNHAKKRFHCPIIFDPQMRTMGKDVTEPECQSKCRNSDINRSECHAKYHCRSPWRLCYVCTLHGDFYGDNATVFDLQSGLCEFHTKNSREKRRPRTPVKSVAEKAIQLPIPKVLKTSAHDSLARRNNGNQKHDSLPPALVSMMKSDVVAIPKGAILTINCERIRPMEDQPREYFDEEELEALAGSIAEIGQLDPGKVRRLEDDPEHDWELVDGQRRLFACTIAGVSYRAFEIEVKDREDQFLKACVSNFCKASHTELEEARAVRRLNAAGHTIERIAKMLGRSSSWVNQRLALLRLAPEIHQLMDPRRAEEERLSVTTALFLARYPDNFQVEMAKEILSARMKSSSAAAFIFRKTKEAGLERQGVRQREPRKDLQVLERFCDNIWTGAERFIHWDETYIANVLRSRKSSSTHEEIYKIKSKLKDDISLLQNLLKRIEECTTARAKSA